MATVRENMLKRKAYQIAGHAYNLFATGQGTGSLGLSQGDFRKLGKDKDSIMDGLADKYYERLLKAYPADKWNDQESMTLDKMKIEDVANTLIDEKNPANLKKKMEFSAYKDLIAPTEEGAKNWYQMDQEQIGKAMRERGFNNKNRNDVKKFFDKLSEHDINYNRGKIVEEEYENANPFQKFAMAAFPSVRDEAVKQSLTGDYDDWKMYRAFGTDAAIGTAMGLVPGGLLPTKGMTSAGKAALLGLHNPGTSKLLNPLYSGLTDAGLETVRQGIDLAEGREFNKGDIATAGVTAATVPAAVMGLRQYAKRGNSILSTSLSKGFMQGAKGAENPLRVERDELKQLLLDVRGVSNKGRNTVVSDGKLRKAANSMNDIDKAELRGEAKRKLMILGLRSREDEDALESAVRAAQSKFNNARQSLDQVIDSHGVLSDKAKDDLIKMTGRRVDKAQDELEAALSAQKKYADEHADFFGIPREKYPYVEDVIGGSPEQGTVKSVLADAFGYEPYKQGRPTLQVESVLKKYYDKPVKPNIWTETGYMDTKTAEKYAAAKKAIKETFKEKAAAEGEKTDKSKVFMLARPVGKVVGEFGTRFEPNIKLRKYEEKAEAFKKSKWFKSLPKEKKNAIEKALKGEE